MADITYTVEVELGGFMTDVTALVDGFVCGGGRDREYDQFTAGSASFAIDDRTGDYVPQAGGTWSDEKWIGREVKITATCDGTANVIWRGHVEDLDVEVAGMFYANLSVLAVDPLALLSRTEIDAGTTFSSELSSVRIDNVLGLPEVDGNYFNVTAGTKDFDTGEITLQAESDAGGNTLAYLDRVVKSEQGRLFIAHSGSTGGVLTFRSRNSVAPDSGLTFQDEDAGTATSIPYERVDLGFGSGLLANRVTYTREGGSAQTAEDTDSQTAYGVRAVSETGLLTATDPDALTAAEYRLYRYVDPTLDVVGMTVLLDVLSDTQAAAVLGLTVGERVDVTVNPPGYGTNGSMTVPVRIEKVSHAASAAGSHTVTFRLSSLNDEFARYDDATYDAASSTFAP